MPKKRSAGLLPYKFVNNQLQVFLIHPGGPFYTKKDFGAWSIAKGEVDEGEDLLTAACRELTEETGLQPGKDFIDLGEVSSKSGKIIKAWAFEVDWPQNITITSNTFPLEWPPHSGQIQQFPEVDRAEFFDTTLAKQKINTAQVPFIERLMEKLKVASSPQSQLF